MTVPADAADALVIGIDAGGTRTRAALAGAGGTVLRCGAAGPGNALTVPLDRLTEHLAQAVAAVADSGDRPRIRAVVAGFAGSSGSVTADPRDPGSSAALTALRAALDRLAFAPRAVEVRSDTDVAFAAAPGAPKAGLVLIAGTGAVAVRIADRRAAGSVDGHGWLLGDAGSGFWIGRRAVRAALRAIDGRGRPTALVPAVTEHYLGHPVPAPPAGPAGGRELRSRLVQAVMGQPPVRLAGICPLVTEAAAQGDRVAGRILDRAADRLAAAMRALHPRPGEVLVTSGGLLGPDGALLGRFTQRIAGTGVRPVPVSDGLPGAVVLARLALKERA